ncbi:MAG: M48 family metallopeptidase [Phycisphaerae bacterium]|nr:M48 family metallopeptidase [Phycisphaerae bacterium]
MNFFRQQDAARRRTGLLIVIFALCVVALILSVQVALATLLKFFELGPRLGEGFDPWNPRLVAMVAVIVGGAVLMGGLNKFLALREGGATVALALGGRPLLPGGATSTERRLLNVVEEMAIASGTPVPPVYVLDEERGINAFAAGYDANDAIIGVTRGCIERLERDELQGVVAHEFSHILNGDMRLNIRLISVLHGMMAIALVGNAIVRGSLETARHARRAKNTAPILIGLVVGAVLSVLGSLGVFFGRLLQCAVSRQREYLADASAVQFTRHPDGLAGALKKIGATRYGSVLLAPGTDEISHLLFSDGLRRRFSLTSLLSTHPPLELRIRRLDPSFDGKFPSRPTTAELAAMAARTAPFAPTTAPRPRPPEGLPPEAIVARVGDTQPSDLLYGEELLAAIPLEIRDAAAQPLSATAIVYCMLMNAEPDARARQKQLVREQVDRPVRQEMVRLFAAARRLDPRMRLPVVELAVSALRGTSPAQCERLLEIIDRLADADEQQSVFEFCLRVIVRRRLAHVLTGARHRAVQYYSITALEDEVSLVLSLLAGASGSNREAAFRIGAARVRLPRGRQLEQHDPKRCAYLDVRAALDKIAAAVPQVREAILDACAHCVLADRVATVREAELLRAVAIAIGCPLPPFLPRVGPAHDETPPVDSSLPARS